jgi:hypothetical protein
VFVPNSFDHRQTYKLPVLRMLSLHSSTSLNLHLFQHLQILSFAIMLKLTSLSVMPRFYCAIIPLPRMAGKSRESPMFFYQVEVAVWNAFVRIQVNHLSVMLLIILLFPCLLKAVSSGTPPNPRVVIVSSVAHYWTKFTKAEVESDKILQKLSDKNYCTSR